MKRLKLKINRNLVLAVAFAGIMGATAYCGGIEAAGTTLAFTGIVAGLKKDKKWDDLDEDTQKFAEQADKVSEALHKNNEDLKVKLANAEKELGELKGLIGDTDVSGLPKDLKKKFEELQESVKSIAEKVEKSENQVERVSGVNFKAAVTKALEEKKSDLESAAKDKGVSVSLTFKANDSVLTTGYSSSAPNSYLPVPNFIPGFTQSPEVAVTIMDVVDMGTSDSPTVTWVNEKPIEGDAGWTAENELKSQVAWKYENETSSAVKVTAFIKVTTQALRNIPWLASRINSRLMELVRRKIQDGIINGDGTNEAPNGIINQVSSYTTDSFDDSVDDPTIADALMAMAGQIEELEYETNNLVAVMNGVDIRKMKWGKDKDGRYMVPNFFTQNGTYVDNMRVIKNNKVPKGYALVGDMKKFTVLMVDNLMIDIGLDGNDFTYNRRTVICEAELITMISENDLGAIVYANLDAVRAEIDAAV